MCTQVLLTWRYFKGDFVIIKTDQNTVHDIKIKGMIVHILLPQHVRHLKKIGKFPAEFDEEKNNSNENEKQQKQKSNNDDEEDKNSDDDEIYQGNLNRKPAFDDDEEEEEDDD